MCPFNLKPLVLLATLTISCGGGTKNREISQPPIRTGGQLESIPVTYQDTKPSISDDGTKVVFVSGRDTNEEGAQFRIYKSTWPTGETPSEATRLTTEDLGFEKIGKVSPDGETVAMIVSTAGSDKVYRIPFAGGSMTAVSEEAGEIDQLQFSPDSALVVWRQSDESSGRAIYLADLVGGTPQKLDLSEDVDDVFWVPTGTDGSYKLGMQAIVSSQETIRVSTAFATVAESADSTFSVLGDSFVSGDVKAKASADIIFSSVRVLPSGEETFARLGDLPATEKSPLFASNVETKPYFVSVADGSVTEMEELPGDAIQGLNIVDGGYHLLARHGYQCVGDSSLSFGWSIVSLASDGSSLTRRYPKLTNAGNWEVTESVCDRIGDDQLQASIDDRVNALSVAGDGSLATFRAVFETRFSSKKDDKCKLKSGDPEIRVLEVTADGATISELSSNPYSDLADSDRGDSGPCP